MSNEKSTVNDSKQTWESNIQKIKITCFPFQLTKKHQIKVPLTMCTNHLLGSLYVHKQCLILTAYPSFCQWPSSSNYTARQICKNSVQEFFIKSWHPSSSSMKGRSKASLLRAVNDSLPILSTLFVWYGLNSKDVYKILCYPYAAYSVVFNKSPNTRTQ